MEINELFSKIRQHAWIGALVFAVCSVSFFFYQRQTEKNERLMKEDYKVASGFALEIAKGKEPSKESLEQMAVLLERRPELAPSFDNILAITSFSLADHELGTRVASRLIERTQPLVEEPITSFSKISLLIESGNLTEAKSAALSLEEKLSSSPSFEVLRAYNLIRLAFLNKDRNYLDKLKTLPVYAEIEPLFCSGTLTLENFIQP